MSRWVGLFLGPDKLACESYFSNPINDKIKIFVSGFLIMNKI